MSTLSVPWLLLALALLLAAGYGIALARRLHRLLEDCRESEALLQLAIDDAGEHALLVLDPAGGLMQWNAAAAQLHGYTAAEVVGSHYSRLFISDDRVTRLAQDALEVAARDGRHAFDGWRQRKDGSRFPVHAVMKALRTPSGRLRGFACLERDLSERVRNEQALAEARSSLAQAQRLAAVGRLSEGIAHDFSNVVQVIDSCAQTLQRQLAGHSAAAEALQMIQRNAERAAALSRHLLSLSRQHDCSSAPTNVNEVVADVIELLRHTFSENIAVDLSVDEGLSWAQIDRNALEAALVNLAANARDALPHGGQLSVATAEVLWPHEAPNAAAAERPRHYIQITLSRDGPEDAASSNGMEGWGTASVDAAVLDGEPTASADTGLEMVRSFVEQWGGQLQVEGGGAVRLYIPCRAG